MDNLPIEIVFMITKHLSIRDLLRLRLVSKKWKFFADEGNINKLIISDGLGIYKSYWFFTNEKILGNGDICRLNTLIKFNFITGFRLSRHLRRLNINYLERTGFDLKYLECFSRLEHLEINCSLFGTPVLNLPNLRILKLRKFIDDCKLILNTPSLEIMETSSFAFIEVQHPNSIKYLRTSSYQKDLEQFQSLEVIKFSYLVSLNEKILSIFKQLKRLDLFVEEAMFHECYSEFKCSINKVLDERIKLRRMNFKLYFEGVEIRNGLNELPISRLDFQLQNYNQLSDDLSFVLHFNYNELVNCTNNIPINLPIDFFHKFFNICFIKVKYKVDNPAHLSYVLRKIKRFHVIEFFDTLLSQDFYDQLGSECDLRILKIDENFDLGDNFDNLFELTVELFINSRFLKKLSIKYLDKTCEVYKITDDCFNLRYLETGDNKTRLTQNHLYFIELCDSLFKLEKSDQEKKS